MAKDREKEREAELKSAMYTNYLHLSLDPAAPPSRRAAPLLPPLLPPRPRVVRQGLRPGVADLRFRAVQGVPQDCARDYKTHTTRSWDFVGLNYHQPSGLLQKAKYGEDVIVGRRYNRFRYSLVPARWRGACEALAAFNTTSCNRKIIDAEF